MNAATIYRDDYSQMFAQEPVFLGFLRERESNARWNKEPSNALRFEALEEGFSVTQLLLDNYAMGGREGILKNTRLLLKASDRYYLVRGCAVKTIVDRARVSGSALSESLNTFRDQLEFIFSQYTKALGNLTALLDVDVSYPSSTMLGVMKRISIPKKLAYQAADLFKAQYGEDGCTAHEVYYGISEVLLMLHCDGASGSRIGSEGNELSVAQLTAHHCQRRTIKMILIKPHKHRLCGDIQSCTVAPSFSSACRASFAFTSFS